MVSGSGGEGVNSQSEVPSLAVFHRRGTQTRRRQRQLPTVDLYRIQSIFAPTFSAGLWNSDGGHLTKRAGENLAGWALDRNIIFQSHEEYYLCPGGVTCSTEDERKQEVS